MAFQFEGKKPGDIIKSSDWNTLNTEVVRLGTDKVDRAGDTVNGDLTVTGKVNVGGTLSVTGAGAFNNNVDLNGNLNLTANKELAFAENGQIRSGDNNHRILFRRAENKLELREFGQIVFSPGATAGAETAKVVLLDNGNVGIGAANPAAKLSVVATGAQELGGSARSTTFLTSAGSLGTSANSELALATIGFDMPSGNRSSLGIRARRIVAGTDWPSTAIGLGMDVDDTVFAGASLWLHANGNVGIGTATPEAKLDVRGGLAILEQEAWKDAPLANGWVNYQNSYNPAQYFRDSLGVVHLRGLIRDGANGTIAFALPAGYRPTNRQLHVVSINPNVAGRIDVDADGNVIIVSGDPGWVGLDSISFRVA